jgi:hypothetical protein
MYANPFDSFVYQFVANLIALISPKRLNLSPTSSSLKVYGSPFTKRVLQSSGIYLATSTKYKQSLDRDTLTNLAR